MSSRTRDSPSSSTFVSNPLNVDIVIEEILSYLALGDEEQLLNYRLVSHKWNDIIVNKFKKSGRRFQISLRYDHQVPKSTSQSVSKRSSNQILDSAILTLKGTAARLTFDTIVVGRGFYLAHGVQTKWKELLKIQGKCIHHLKLHYNRGGESTEAEESFHQVLDCQELISINCLRATFSAIPALETLDFSIQFTNSNQQLLFPTGHDIPRLENLTKMTIRGTHKFYSGVEFLRDIFSMAPNLSAFYSKPSNYLSVVAIALNAKEGRQRVTTLGIDNVVIHRGLAISDELVNGMWLYHHLQFPFFQLTTLELNNIFCDELVLSCMWITELLRSHSSTLVKLVLGTRKNNPRSLMHPLSFLPIMTALKVLEINLTKFVIFKVESYDTKFPVLQSLTLTGGHIYGKGWNMTHLGYLLPGQNGRSNTLEEFSLISRPLQQSIKNEILPRIYSTFPMAEYHFDS